MVRIQRLPFVLPKNIRFSSESIHIDSTGYSYDENRFIGCGSSLFFNEELYKYVITFRVRHLYVDLFLFSLPTENNEALYPIMIKYYDTRKDILDHDKHTLLIRSGINNILNMYTNPGSIGDYKFIAQGYIREAIKSCYPGTFEIANRLDDIFNSPDILTEVDYREYDTNINLLNYINNECNPSCEFSFDNFMRNLHLDYYRYPADPSRHVDMASATIFDTLCPEVPTAILREPILIHCMRTGRLLSHELLDYFSGKNIVNDNNVYTDTTIPDIINKSTVTTYVCCLSRPNTSDELDIAYYSLYELFQRIPITDGYIRYILHNEDPLKLDHSSYISNYLLNYLDNRLTNDNHIVGLIGREVLSLAQFNVFNELVTTIEVIIRDYHALVVVRTITAKQWTIVVDLVALSLLSKTLMLTDYNNYL